MRNNDQSLHDNQLRCEEYLQGRPRLPTRYLFAVANFILYTRALHGDENVGVIAPQMRELRRHTERVWRLRGGYNCASISIRLRFHRTTTIRRPRYDRKPNYAWLLLLHCDLNKQTGQRGCC